MTDEEKAIAKEKKKLYRKEYSKKNKEKIRAQQRETDKAFYHRHKNDPEYIEKKAKYREEYNEKSENKEKKAATSKAYYTANVDEIAEKSKEYRLLNKEAIALRNKNDYNENRKVHQERGASYYRNNKEKVSARHKIWGEKHKEELSEKNKKHYADNAVLKRLQYKEKIVNMTEDQLLEYRTKKRAEYAKRAEDGSERVRGWARHGINITLDEYNARLVEQRERCKCCDRHRSLLFKELLVVDHDHETNVIRGLLCNNCNLGIGHFKDDPSIIRLAINYLADDGKDAETNMSRLPCNDVVKHLPKGKGRPHYWRTLGFHLTNDEYNAIFVAQNGKCKACGISHDLLNLRLAVDHNHSSGKIRGLLCGCCNSGLGMFKDDVQRLEAAINYLIDNDK